MLAFCIFCSSLLFAQEDNKTGQSYKIKYVKEHLFLRDGDDFNVIDAEIEWPLVVDYTVMEPLQTFLIKNTMELNTADMDEAYPRFISSFGRPVIGSLEKIPDDNRFCYIDLKIKIKSYEPQKFIAFIADCNIEPQNRSKVKARRVYLSAVYDLQRQIVLGAEDILKEDAVKTRAVHQDFFDALLSPLSDDDYDNLQSSMINGVWFEDKNVGFHVVSRTHERKIDYDIFMPYENIRYLITKKGRKVIEGKPTGKQLFFLPKQQVLKGDTIYEKVDQIPQYQGGKDAMMNYFRQMPSSNNPNIKGKVILSFIIDKEGKMQSISVVHPLHPMADRRAVNMARGLRNWEPRRNGHEPVCVRMYLPIQFE